MVKKVAILKILDKNSISWPLVTKDFNEERLNHQSYKSNEVMRQWDLQKKVKVGPVFAIGKCSEKFYSSLNFDFL